MTRKVGVVVSSDALIDRMGPLPDEVTLLPLTPGDEPDTAQRSAPLLVLAPDLTYLLPRLADLEGLTTIQTLNAGVEWLLPHIPAGVAAHSASGAHDIPVAEWVLAAVLSLYHQFPRYHDAQRREAWDPTGNALTTPPKDIPGDDLHAKKVTIVGYGSIGRATERRMAAFGADVRGVSRRGGPGVATPDGLGALLADTDVLVLLCPLTEATRGMIDADVLAALPDAALVVNAARGPVLDQAALEAEVRAGRLRAALDVTDPEPLPDGHSLWSAPGLLITPHSAGSSRHWMDRAYAFAGDQVRRFAAGQPLLNLRTDG